MVYAWQLRHSGMQQAIWFASHWITGNIFSTERLWEGEANFFTHSFIICKLHFYFIFRQHCNYSEISVVLLLQLMMVKNIYICFTLQQDFWEQSNFDLKVTSFLNLNCNWSLIYLSLIINGTTFNLVLKIKILHNLNYHFSSIKFKWLQFFLIYLSSFTCHQLARPDIWKISCRVFGYLHLSPALVQVTNYQQNTNSSTFHTRRNPYLLSVPLISAGKAGGGGNPFEKTRDIQCRFGDGTGFLWREQTVPANTKQVAHCQDVMTLGTQPTRRCVFCWCCGLIWHFLRLHDAGFRPRKADDSTLAGFISGLRVELAGKAKQRWHLTRVATTVQVHPPLRTGKSLTLLISAA